MKNFLYLLFLLFIASVGNAQTFQRLISEPRFKNIAILRDSTTGIVEICRIQSGQKNGDYIKINDSLRVTERGTYRDNVVAFRYEYTGDSIRWMDNDSIFNAIGEYHLFLNKFHRQKSSKGHDYGFYKEKEFNRSFLLEDTLFEDSLIRSDFIFKGYILTKSSIRSYEELKKEIFSKYDKEEIDSFSVVFFVNPKTIYLNNQRNWKVRSSVDIAESDYSSEDVFFCEESNNAFEYKIYYECDPIKYKFLRIQIVDGFVKFIYSGEGMDKIIEGYNGVPFHKLMYHGIFTHLGKEDKILQQYTYKDSKLVRFYQSENGKSIKVGLFNKKLRSLPFDGFGKHYPIFYENKNGKYVFYPEYSDPFWFYSLGQASWGIRVKH